MKQTYNTPSGKSFVAQINGNILTMYVPRQDGIVKMKIPPAHRSKLGHAIKRPCFYSFAAVVDEIEG